MSQTPCLPGAATPEPLSAILGLFNALVAILARPSSIEAMLQEALDTLVAHFGATGGAAAIWAPGAPEPGLMAACGTLRDGLNLEGLGGHPELASGHFDPDVLRSFAFEWGEAVASSSGQSLLGATAWLSHRSEYGLACIVGPQGQAFDPWRQEALAAAAGLVGHAMERMRLGSEIEARLAQRDARWSSLYDIGVALTRDLDNEGLIDMIVRRAIDLLGARGGALSMLDEATGNSVVTVAYVDGEPAPFMVGHLSKPGEGVAGQVIASGEPLMVSEHQFEHVAGRRAPVATALVAAPLFVSGHCVGALAVGDRATARSFTRDDLQTLVLLAQQAGALLERVQGRARDELLTVHRERARLARELHDGLAQNLASLLMKAELCHDLARTATPQLQRELDLLADGLQRAIRETRAAIFSLHDSNATSERLVDALRLLAARFESQTGQSVVLTWEGDPGRSLPFAQHTALMRVTQEALTNVRKHAQGTRVCVHLNASCPNIVELSVRDDGRGFEPDLLAHAPGDRYGLIAMRERIAALGGTLGIQSGIGCGTTVTVVLPVGNAGASEAWKSSLS